MKRLLGISFLLLLVFAGCKSALFSKKEADKKPEASLTDNQDNNLGPEVTDDGKITVNAPLTMTVEERLMIDEINLVRKDPQAYIPKVKDYIQSVRKDPSVSESYKHEESATARELIFELSRLSPLPELKPHEGLYQCGIAHAIDVRKLASMTHVGLDGSYPWDRIGKMTDLPDGNENLVGGGKTIRESLIILLVDSDVAGRGHRLNILNPKWRYAAAHKVGIVGGVNNSWIQLFGTEPAPEEEPLAADRSSQPVDRTTAPLPTAPQTTPVPAEKTKKAKKERKLFGRQKKAEKPKPTAGGNTTSTNDPSPTSSNISNLSSGEDFSFMRAEEKKMIEEINLLRSNPKGYISYVRAYIEEYKKAGWDEATTKEEIETADELIAELEKLSPLSILKPNAKLHQVAVLHGKDMQKMEQVSHVGSDGMHPYQRIRKATGLKEANENLVGGAMSVRESVIMLLVDSGIFNRGHRRTLLEPKWEYVACYKVGDVGAMPNTWVQNFAGK